MTSCQRAAGLPPSFCTELSSDAVTLRHHVPGMFEASCAHITANIPPPVSHNRNIYISVCVKETKHRSLKTFSLPYTAYSNDGKWCEREKLLLWFESICSYRVEVPDLQGFVIGCRNQKVGVRGPGHIRYTLRVCQCSLEMHVK